MGEENKEPEISPIEDAKKTLEENKKVLAELREERQKIEKAVSDNMLGGRSMAGQPQPTSEEQKRKEEAQRRADEMVKAFRR